MQRYRTVHNYFKIIKYAEDTTLSRTFDIGNFKNIDHLSHISNIEIIKINTWLKVNKLSLNVKKSQFMINHKSARNFNLPEIVNDNVPLKYVDKFSFLGITIQNSLQWDAHIDDSYMG